MRAFLAAAIAAVPLFAAHPVLADTPSGALTLSRSVDGRGHAVATLFCDPDGGTHTSPKPACDLLRETKGDLGRRVPNPDVICTKEYLPHRVTAFGTWEGRPVRYTRTFGNRCEMNAVTGAVFNF